ncbi:MAG: RelA/SpoT family protein [Candidatus Komeilibacteria bacterium]|nr:RelA/SpoT family protein [Candidatus Komeilibacteria bacterium]
MILDDLLQSIQQNIPYISRADLQLVSDAYQLASLAHSGQKRHSGEDYIQHPMAVAIKLAEMKADITTIIAGLLHDVPENTPITLEEIESTFGAEVANLVDGVTKLGILKYRGLERYTENLRKMFVAMAEDIRVIIIRFADRIHNLQTLEWQRPDKRRRIALESIEIYAAIAHRLGMWQIKGELEDLAFPYAYPKEYQWTISLAQNKLKIQEKYLEKIKRLTEKELLNQKIPYLDLSVRKKHLYSLYKKLVKKEGDLDKVYDIIALRIIVKNIPDCYRVLGLIHQLWTPLKGRVKDYIAQPKLNGYQSLHTTVFCEQGQIVEFQIRNQEMEEVSEFGIAAHWLYKETPQGKNKIQKDRLVWVKALKELKSSPGSHQDFLEQIKSDIIKNRILVFTPKGDVIDLPEGSTPIDFAYRVHSDLGNSCQGAVINDQLVSLDTPLKSGDVVSVLTNKNKKVPSSDWLQIVKTYQAKEKIRDALKKEQGNFVSRLLRPKK